MPSRSWPIHSSIVSRSIHVLSVLLVFSYILFDVLDLDGSNFPRLLHARGKDYHRGRVCPLARSLIIPPNSRNFADDIVAPRCRSISRLNVRPSWAEALKRLATRHSSISRLPSGPRAKLSSGLLSLFVTAVFSLIL